VSMLPAGEVRGRRTVRASELGYVRPASARKQGGLCSEIVIVTTFKIVSCRKYVQHFLLNMLVHVSFWLVRVFVV
jgi:hypothetical protein